MNTNCIKNRLISTLVVVALVITSMAFPITSWAKDKAPTYWLKVNTRANVVNVYVKSGQKWKPYKVMLCSCGLATNEDNTTPAGTYKLAYKWRWLSLVENQSGQYVSQITGDYLFHSVPYNTKYDYSSQFTKEFNKLGKKASHGCVRLSVMDAKWIYQNCPTGTKITVYSSKKAGPLGKPKGIKVSTKKKTGWDPTDTRKGNPNYKLPKPVITSTMGDKVEILEGTKLKLASIVKASDPNTKTDLTSKIKISYIKRYDIEKAKYVEDKFSTDKPAKFKVKYRVYDKYCGNGFKTIYISVVPIKIVEPNYELE